MPDDATFNAGPKHTAGQALIHGVEVGPALCALRRLRQIVDELRTAVELNDLEVAGAACRLLEPTVRECGSVWHYGAEMTGETAETAVHIRAVLIACETILTANMERVRLEMKRVRLGKRAIAQSRSRTSAQFSVQTLNTER